MDVRLNGTNMQTVEEVLVGVKVDELCRCSLKVGKIVYGAMQQVNCEKYGASANSYVAVLVFDWI